MILGYMSQHFLSGVRREDPALLTSLSGRSCSVSIKRDGDVSLHLAYFTDLSVGRPSFS